MKIKRYALTDNNMEIYDLEAVYDSGEKKYTLCSNNNNESFDILGTEHLVRPTIIRFSDNINKLK